MRGIDPLAPGTVVVISDEQVADAGCDGDSGLAVVTGTSGTELRLRPFAVIGGEDGHVDGCTPLPWPGTGELPFLVARREDVKLLTGERADCLCAALRQHLAAGNHDRRVGEMLGMLASSAQ